MKALFPALSVAGIVGGIASAIGLAPPSLVESVPKYEIEIPDQISAEVTCNGNVWDQKGNRNQSARVTFGWTLKLENKDKEELRKKQSVSKNANVFIKNNGRQDWWPIMRGDAIETLNVRTLPTKHQLEIQLNATPVPSVQQRGEFYYSVGNKTASLVCEGGSDLVKAGRGQMVYSLGTRKQGRKYTKTDITTPLKVTVSLKKCEPKGGEKQTECPLTVLTGSDLDWSSKVSQKATLKVK